MLRVGALAAAVALLAASGAATAASLSDPQDHAGTAADLRRVTWNVGPQSAEVVLEAYAPTEPSTWDYLAALFLGNLSAPQADEAYYLQHSASRGPVLVAQHAPEPQQPTPVVSRESGRLHFSFPRVLPANGTDASCTFAVAATGHFGEAFDIADSVPDGGGAGAPEPWALRGALCAPPPPVQRTPLPGALAALGLAAAAGLSARRRS